MHSSSCSVFIPPVCSHSFDFLIYLYPHLNSAVSCEFAVCSVGSTASPFFVWGRQTFKEICMTLLGNRLVPDLLQLARHLISYRNREQNGFFPRTWGDFIPNNPLCSFSNEKLDQKGVMFFGVCCSKFLSWLLIIFAGTIKSYLVCSVTENLMFRRNLSAARLVFKSCQCY